VLLFGSFVEDKKSQQILSLLFFPVVIVILAIGVQGISFFIGSVVVSNAILFPRWNAEALGAQYGNTLFYWIFFPVICYFLAILAIASLHSYKSKRNEGIYARNRPILARDGLFDQNVAGILTKEPSILDNYLNGIGIKNANDRCQCAVFYKKDVLKHVTTHLIEDQINSGKTTAMKRHEKTLQEAMVTLGDLQKLAQTPNAFFQVLHSMGVEPVGERVKLFLELRSQPVNEDRKI